MKTTTTIILLLLFLGSPMATAQDLLDALKQTADMHNEAHGENNGDNSDSELTPQQEEWQRQWEAEWEAQQNAELLDKLDSKYLRCLAMMEMYVYMYLKLVNEHKLGDVGMSECDAYGMQTLAMAASTTIMYCPEGMKEPEMSENERTMVFSEYARLINEEEPLQSIHKYLLDKHLEFFSDSGFNLEDENTDHLFSNFVVYLMEFFTPYYIIPRTLEIAQEMEALGCSKPN